MELLNPKGLEHPDSPTLMKKIIRYLLIFIFLTVLTDKLTHAQEPNHPTYLPNRVIVKYKNYITTAQTTTVTQHSGILVDKQVNLFDQTFVVHTQSGFDIERAVTKLNNNPDVEYAEPDYIAQAFYTPNDPFLNQQWGLSKIAAQQAWDTTRGNSNIVVAVLDTGADFNHKDLQTTFVSRGFDFINNDNDASDDHGHGTHVSGIVAAVTDNNTSIAGTGFNIKVLPVKVLNSAGSGGHSAIAAGIDYAIQQGAKVINMSLGGSQSSNTLAQKITDADNSGLVIVASAGNESTSQPIYPAAYPEVISVLATNQNDQRASFSNYGSTVDVGAPGEGILSTVRNSNDYPCGCQSWDGTSMASPFVAGLAGLVFSIQSNLTNQQVRACIEGNVDVPAGWQTSWGRGRINAANTVTNAKAASGCSLTGGPGPTATPSPIGAPTATPTHRPSPTLTLTPIHAPSPTLTLTPRPTHHTPTPTPPASPTHPPGVTPTTPPGATPTPTPTPLPNFCQRADFNGDGKVNQIEVDLLINNFGGNNTQYDLNSDGLINTMDVSMIMVCWKP